MKVKIIRNTVAQKKTVRVGETHDLPDDEARYLIFAKKAVPSKAEPKTQSENPGGKKPSVAAAEPPMKKDLLEEEDGPVDLNRLNKEALLDIAADRGVDIAEGATKKDIIAALEGAAKSETQPPAN